MTELEELKLRVTRARRLIADLRDEITTCRQRLGENTTPEIDSGLDGVIAMLDGIDAILGGDR